MFRSYVGLVGICLLAFMAFLDFTIVNTALPAIQKSLNVPVIELQWVINAFCIILTMFMIIAGKLADIQGHRRIFYVGTLLFVIGSLGAGLSPTFHSLVLFRAIQGLGAAIFFTVSVAIIAELFPNKGQTRALGIYSGITGLGLAIGPALGGIIVKMASWHWIFFINLPIAFIGLCCCIPNLKKSPKLQETIDWPSAICLILFSFFLVYGIIVSAHLGWHLKVLSYMGIAALSFLFLCIRQNYSRHPLLDFSIYTNPALFLLILTCVAAAISSGVLMFFSPLYLSHVLAKDALTIGLLLVTMPLMQVLLSIFITPLDRLFNIINICVVSIFSALGATFMEYHFGLHTSLAFVIMTFLLIGISWGAANTGSIIVINRLLPPEKVAGTAGTVYTHWNLFGSTLLAGASVIFNHQQKHYTNQVIPSSYQALIQHHLNNPAHRLSVLHGENVMTSPHILHLKLMFLSGFNAVMYWGSAALVVVIVVTLWTRFKIKAASIKAS